MDRYNVVVVGAGSGGLVVAAGAAGLGAKAALLEKHRMGGDCLNYGCVPSKALLHAAAGTRDLGKALEWVRAAQRRIEPHDSEERFTGLGVDVFRAAGRLKNAHEVEVVGTGKVLRGRHVVIATGSRPKVPAIPGLAEAGYHTNETIFSIDGLPSHLVILGGGPVGCELGQAFRRLGSAVTIVSASDHVLPREDPDVAEVLASRLRAEGIEILDGARAERVTIASGRKVVHAAEREIAGDAILVAVGRDPNVEELGLDAAGVSWSERGIAIDATGRTTAKSVWAIGDVAGERFFTHWAGHQARVVVQNVLFPATARWDAENLPWATFTDPEVARVGLDETEAKAKGIPYTLVRAEFDHNDRAICVGEWEGYFAKALADRKGRILGATIVHPRAGELLAELVLAKKHRLTLSQISSTIHAYPTLSEIGRSLGDAWRRNALTPSRKAWLTRIYGWLR